MLCHLFTCFSATALRNWKIWQMTTCWAIRAGKPHGPKKTPTRSDLYTIVINYEGFPLATRQKRTHIKFFLMFSFLLYYLQCTKETCSVVKYFGISHLRSNVNAKITRIFQHCTTAGRYNVTVFINWKQLELTNR